MIDRIKKLCAKKGISIHKLEMDLGYANASISNAKPDKIGGARVKAIADYFDVPMEYILTGDVSRMNVSNDLALLEKFHSLNDANRRVIMTMIDTMLSNQ